MFTIKWHARLLSLLAFSMIACVDAAPQQEAEAEKDLQSFLSTYFNWQFVDAEKWVTPSSRPLLAFAASQITENDLQLLRSKETPVETNIERLTISADTLAEAVVCVRNAMVMKAIGTPCQLVPEQTYYLRITKTPQSTHWLVDLSTLKPCPSSTSHR